MSIAAAASKWKVTRKALSEIVNERNPQTLRMAHLPKNLDTGDLDAAVMLVAEGTRWFASVSTQYNPVFGVINFARNAPAQKAAEHAAQSGLGRGLLALRLVSSLSTSPAQSASCARPSRRKLDWAGLQIWASASSVPGGNGPRVVRKAAMSCGPSARPSYRKRSVILWVGCCMFQAPEMRKAQPMRGRSAGLERGQAPGGRLSVRGSTGHGVQRVGSTGARAGRPAPRCPLNFVFQRTGSGPATRAIGRSRTRV